MKCSKWLCFAGGMLLLSACGTTEKASERAEDFYTFLQKEDLQKALDLVHQEGLLSGDSSDAYQPWRNLLTDKQKRLGRLLTFSEKDSKSRQEGEYREILLRFETEYEKGKLYELIAVKEEGPRRAENFGKGDFAWRISEYQYAETEAELEAKWRNF
jgi:hypothetical protein